MKTKLFTTIALSALLVFGGANTAEAAQNVQVKIPAFPVELNDRVYDNQHAAYPLLVYKDITYFPMTFYLTRNLGLSTGWDAEKGLYIVQHQEPYYGETDEMTGNYSLQKTYNATIPTYPIVVNGWAVDNSKEEYPLLNFKGVTYFPLTWQYANDEFDWKIAWDAEEGLRVNSYNHSDGDMYLMQMTEDYALFEQSTSIYESYQTADGATAYKQLGIAYKVYQLDFAADTLRLIGNDSIEKTWSAHPRVECADQFTVEDGKLYYDGQMILEGVPTDQPRVLAYCYPSETANMLAVTVLYTDQPTPYTPKVQYAFLQTGETIKRIAAWDSADYSKAFYETVDAYYACSGGHNVISRMNNGLSTIIRIDKVTGEEIVLNDLYEDYTSLEVIGVVDDKLYVRAVYFGDEADLKKIEYYSYKVSPINDGYFYIDGQMQLHKVHDYIDGTAFLNPSGTLYVYNSEQGKIVNLSEHAKVTMLEE